MSWEGGTDNAEMFERLKASHDRLLAALKRLLQFNEELCADINMSKHYPSAEEARAAIAAAEKTS
jgi:hypothetical protein